MSENKVATTVYAESTPNPKVMKFVANRAIIEGDSVEFMNLDEGFHFYNGNGLYKDTILTGEGNKYRGSGKDIFRYGRNTRPNLT